MTRRCTPDCMKARMAPSSRHTVRVQKARSASRRTETARLPAVRLACRAERMDWITNPGTYRRDRTRSRVIDTKGISNGLALLERTDIKVDTRSTEEKSQLRQRQAWFVDW